MWKALMDGSKSMGIGYLPTLKFMHRFMGNHERTQVFNCPFNSDKTNRHAHLEFQANRSMKKLIYDKWCGIHYYLDYAEM